MLPAARVSDTHVCPMSDGPKPHVGGPIIPPAATKTLIGGPFAARVSDMATCAGPPDIISQGAATVLIQGLPAARLSDKTVHGGAIVTGLFTVLIGGPTFSARPVTMVTRFRFGLPPWESRMQYGDGIEIRPDPNDPTYQSRALAALIRLDTTPTMHRAFDAIEGSGNTVVIENYRPGPGEDPYNAYCQPDIIGGGSTVAWNPDVNGFGPPGTTPNWQQPGSDVILGHEMIHATHNATGDDADNEQNGSAVDEERNTVGLPAQTYNYPGDPDGYNGTALPDTTGQPYTENQLRDDYRSRGIDSPVTGNPPEPRPSYYTNTPPVF